MIVHTYEEGGRPDACRDTLLRNADKISVGKVLVLPVPTTRDNIHLKDSGAPLKSVINDADGDTLVIGYGMPSELVLGLINQGALVYDAASDESFLEKNAELTSLATLGIILTSEKRAPGDLSFGIVGFGRIGRSLARMLMFHGSAVRIYTSRESARLELAGAGVSAVMSARDADLSDVDILINTAPAVIFEGEIPSEIRVIDLASGDNFPHTRVEKYPSIPAKMFPKSAGAELALGALRFLSSEKHGI